MNTFSEELRDYWVRSGRKLREVMPVSVAPLSEIVQPYLDAEKTVDYLNVDIEGFDLIALQTWDFDNFPPTVITCEIHGLDLMNSRANLVVEFLTQRGYQLISYTIATGVFVR